MACLQSCDKILVTRDNRGWPGGYKQSWAIFTQWSGRLQGESKKSGISKIMGITSFKYIRKGHIGGVLENSGYLLPDGH